MPPSTFDSETAAMYKSLLLRSFSVQVTDEPEDVRFANAFQVLCEVTGDANRAFTLSWLAHLREQRPLAISAMRHFLDRYEYKSLWNTREVQERLNSLWESTQACADPLEEEPYPADIAASVEHASDPDADKPRVTVREYTALIGEEVMAHLEGLARARKEKHPRAYQTDAEIHQSYIAATSGGAGGGDEDVDEDHTGNTAPSPAAEVFPLVRWDYDADEMSGILDFEHKRRLTPLVKDLLNLPCMQQENQIAEPTHADERRRAQHVLEQDHFLV